MHLDKTELYRAIHIYSVSVDKLDTPMSGFEASNYVWLGLSPAIVSKVFQVCTSLSYGSNNSIICLT